MPFTEASNLRHPRSLLNAKAARRRPRHSRRPARVPGLAITPPCSRFPAFHISSPPIPLPRLAYRLRH